MTNSITISFPDCTCGAHPEVSHTTRLENIILELIEQGKAMSAQLDTLSAQVATNTDVVKSAIVFINGIAAQIIALKTDPVKLQQLADDMKAQDDQLAAAIAANTPAAP